MNKARQAATEKVIELLSMFAGKNTSVEEIEKMLGGMTDVEFDKYMNAMQNGEVTLPYIAPNLENVGLSVENNLKIAKKIGHNFFQHLWLTDQKSRTLYKTPETYLVIDLPLRRQQQHLQEKVSIPGSNRQIDERTGQPTGESQSSRLSFPELQILYSQGLNEPIRELFKFRGGDIKNYNALTRSANNNDFPSMDVVEDPTSRPKVVNTISIYLTAAHLKNNL